MGRHLLNLATLLDQKMGMTTAFPKQGVVADLGYMLKPSGELG
jgi:hypothetical protein